MTNIQWTDQTWNPIVGCSVATAGCTNCYAMKAAWRMGHNPKTPQYHGLTKKVNGNAVWTGDVRLVESALLKPLKRKKPITYFVNSMGDLFHENVPDEWIDRVFAVMALCRQHTFQVLTKRADRMQEYLSRFKPVIEPTSRVLAGKHSWEKVVASGPPKPDYITRDGKQTRLRDKGTPLFSPRRWPLPNVWLGVSVENQDTADERIPQLLATPAALRFISAEPLLGPVNLTKVEESVDTFSDCGGHPDPAVPLNTHNWLWLNTLIGRWDSEHRSPEGDVLGFCDVGLAHDGGAIDWVICGGESGASARPMHPAWARSLRDQCAEAGVPFFFKQWGEWGPMELPATASRGMEADLETGIMRWGKDQTGNALDGKTYEQMPDDSK